ncbi:MAG: hypothetical protein CMP24_05320 [Rickettsiales bacterium]|nr:hypothetical protein [Rickettsiales bacterium]|tara:strand:+ start:187 stop:843 length:657 start_codon:yes stop_codon:yes gene_type:complete
MYFYCERIIDGPYGEPLNSFTNIFFLIASILILKDSFKQKELLLPLIVFFIGISSFAFHTFPTKLNSSLDVFFIVSFMVVYSYKIYKNKFGFNKIISSTITVFFIASSYYLGYYLSTFLIGSSSYYIAIVFHLFLLSYLFKRKQNYNKSSIYLYYATLVFSISLFFRFLDQIICPYLDTGTHFLWHIFNSIVLYLLIKFYLLTPNRSTPEKPTNANKE